MDSFSAGLTGGYNTMVNAANARKEQDRADKRIAWEAEDRDIAHKQRQMGNAMMAFMDSGDTSFFNKLDWDGIQLHSSHDGTYTAVDEQGKALANGLTKEDALTRMYQYMDPSVLRQIRADRQSQANTDRTFTANQEQRGIENQLAQDKLGLAQDTLAETKDYHNKTIDLQTQTLEAEQSTKAANLAFKQWEANAKLAMDKAKMNNLTSEDIHDFAVAAGTTTDAAGNEVLDSAMITMVESGLHPLKAKYGSAEAVSMMGSLIEVAHAMRSKGQSEGAIRERLQRGIDTFLQGGGATQATGAPSAAPRSGAGLPSPTGAPAGPVSNQDIINNVMAAPKATPQATPQAGLPAPERPSGPDPNNLIIDEHGSIWSKNPKRRIMTIPKKTYHDGKGNPYTSPKYQEYLDLVDQINKAQGNR